MKNHLDALQKSIDNQISKIETEMDKYLESETPFARAFDSLCAAFYMPPYPKVLPGSFIIFVAKYLRKNEVELTDQLILKLFREYYKNEIEENVSGALLKELN